MEKEQQSDDGLASIRRKAEAFEHEVHDPAQGPAMWAQLKSSEQGRRPAAVDAERTDAVHGMPTGRRGLVALLAVLLGLTVAGVLWGPALLKQNVTADARPTPVPRADSLARPLAHYRSSKGDLVVIFRLADAAPDAAALRTSAEQQPHQAGAQTTLFYFPGGAEVPLPSAVSGAESTVAAVNRVYENPAVGATYHVFQRYRDGQVRFVSCPRAGDALCK